MALANRLAHCAQTPADSQVYLDGDVRRVYVAIDVDVGELLLAQRLGVDGVIAPSSNRFPRPAWPPGRDTAARGADARRRHPGRDRARGDAHPTTAGCACAPDSH